MSDDILIPLSPAFGNPPTGATSIPETRAVFGVELRSGRIGIGVDGVLHVVELGPEQMLALGAAFQVAGRVAGADEAVALSMLSKPALRALEGLIDRRLVHDRNPQPTVAEAGHA